MRVPRSSFCKVLLCVVDSIFPSISSRISSKTQQQTISCMHNLIVPCPHLIPSHLISSPLARPPRSTIVNVHTQPPPHIICLLFFLLAKNVNKAPWQPGLCGTGNGPDAGGRADLGRRVVSSSLSQLHMKPAVPHTVWGFYCTAPSFYIFTFSPSLPCVGVVGQQKK